jgi:transitional endoplasmic reticulum ATPase
LPEARREDSMARRHVKYLAGAGSLVLIYVVVGAVLWGTRGWDEHGPLSLHAPALQQPLPGALPLSDVAGRCHALEGVGSVGPADVLRIVGGEVRGDQYYACYHLDPAGSVWFAAVLDEEGILVRDVGVLKAGGAWRWIGLVKTPGELATGGVTLMAFLWLYHRYYSRRRPGPPPSPVPWAGRAADIAYLLVPIVGWLAVFLAPGRSRERMVRVAWLGMFAWAAFIVLVLAIVASDYPDLLSFFVLVMLVAGLGYGWLAGVSWIRVPGFGYPDGVSRVTDDEAPDAGWAPASSAGSQLAAEPPPLRASQGSSGSPPVRVESPQSLPDFRHVGGMDDLKTELADTFGLLLAFSDEAEAFRITYNGVLLHGPPGVGKTFIVKATAGEFGMQLMHVSVSDLTSKWVGESARNIRSVFSIAAANIPCLLFFDEFDSVAERRDDDPDQESRRTVNQLLQSLEEYRGLRELVVMAATNHLNKLDRAVIRPGRFDRHIPVPLPDEAARREILRAQLSGRPCADGIDIRELARRTEGSTPASIAQAVETAALAAFRETTLEGELVELTHAHLLGAIASRGGRDRPTIERWSWDRLILAEDAKAELQQLQVMIEDVDAADAYGVKPPTGVLLSGPPGTGKTTIARVFAAEVAASFYLVTASDLTSKWFGESEANVARLFERARENAPSIVFIDEIDAIAASRGQGEVSDRLLNQLLAEMDGLSARQRVFVLAATNRPDSLDSALTRGGRLSRTIRIPLPAGEQREELLELLSAHMPLHGVELSRLASQTEGLSGADLEALCQQAAVEAMVLSARKSAARRPERPRVTQEAFETALDAIRSAKASTIGRDLSKDLEFDLEALTRSRKF